MSLNYELSPEADADLDEVYEYTRQHFGTTQAERYLRSLAGAFVQICEFPASGKRRPDIRQGLRSVVSELHVIYYRQVGMRIRIVRVLHSRMDPSVQFDLSR